jgi:adenylyltransferase/sulfurtransferase
MVQLNLPAPLQEYAGGASRVAVQGSTIGEALHDLSSRFPRLRRHLFDDRGVLRGFVNVYLNDEDMRSLAHGAGTAINDSDTITIVPSVAGGVERRDAGTHG